MGIAEERKRIERLKSQYNARANKKLSELRVTCKHPNLHKTIDPTGGSDHEYDCPDCGGCWHYNPPKIS